LVACLVSIKKQRRFGEKFKKKGKPGRRGEKGVSVSEKAEALPCLARSGKKRGHASKGEGPQGLWGGESDCV